MALYEKKWWQRLFRKKESAERVDVLKDIGAMKEFLRDVKSDAELVSTLVEQLEELEKERQVGTEKVIQINLEAQSGIIDKLTENYTFMQDDMDINASRLRTIANEWLKQAQKAGLSDLVRKKKTDSRWKWI